MGSRYLEIDAGTWRFQPRVAAIIAWHEHLLLQRAIDGDFWVLPGGRLLPLETTEQALARTMRWELDQGVEVGRLLWVAELVATVGAATMHELGFYYAAVLPDGSPFLDLARDHTGVERGHPLTLRWYPAAAVRDLDLRPRFLRTGLSVLPTAPQHVVEVDPDARPPA
jgi:ADP-ribose pyrophosphatase YjhB (NUDIX family)